MSTNRKEAHERADRRKTFEKEKDTFGRLATKRNAELEAIRQRTAELHALRLAQERRGRVRKVVSGARVAKSVTKETLAEWLQAQQRSGRKA